LLSIQSLNFLISFQDTNNFLTIGLEKEQNIISKKFERKMAEQRYLINNIILYILV
jgi:hypothetical protein